MTMLLGKLSVLQGLAPLILRLVLGVIFVAHGYPKLFGGGMEKFVGTVTGKVGMPPFMAYVAALSEFGGAVLLLLGLFTRWAALFIAGVMVVATTTIHWNQGLVKGYEFTLSLLAAALVLMISGGGWLSVDKLIKKEW
jgi:putative oxidoreductase